MNKLNFNKFLHPLLVGAAIAASAAGAKAQQIDNGGFEAGLAGWSVFGDASVQGSAPEGLSQLWLTTASATEQDDFPLEAGALNRSGISPLAVGSPGGVETAVGLPLTALDPDLANGIVAFEGSAASRSVSANAGDVLSFSWNFGTSDSFADYAFFVVDGQRFTLADTSQALLPNSFLGNSFETGVATYSHVFTNAGAHQISFGVVDVGDFGVTSTLAIDNVQISPVPEAPALLMLFAGLAVAALRRR